MIRDFAHLRRLSDPAALPPQRLIDLSRDDAPAPVPRTIASSILPQRLIDLARDDAGAVRLANRGPSCPACP